MAAMIVKWKMRQRQGTAAEWSAGNPVLAAGEFGYDTTNGILKIGDGTTAWNDLKAFAGYDDNDNLQSSTPTADDDVVRLSDLQTLLMGGSLSFLIKTDGGETLETEDSTALQAALSIN